MGAWVFQFNAIGRRSRRSGLRFAFILDGFLLHTPGLDASPAARPAANEDRPG